MLTVLHCQPHYHSKLYNKNLVVTLYIMYTPFKNKQNQYLKLPFFIPYNWRDRNNGGGYEDSISQEVCLIPVQKTRRLIHRTLWDTLRTSVVSGVLRKSKYLRRIFRDRLTCFTYGNLFFHLSIRLFISFS